MIGKVRCIEGLHVFDGNSLKSTKQHITRVVVKKIYMHVWHNRLGHCLIKDFLYSNMIYILIRTRLMRILDATFVLQQNKRSDLFFNKHMAQNAFDLVHRDIWGPFYTTSYNGYWYFLTIFYYGTRFTCVFLLKQKSYVYRIIPRFYVVVVNQFQAHSYSLIIQNN